MKCTPMRRLIVAACAGLLLVSTHHAATAEDRTVLLARFFDGLGSEDYPKAVTNFLPIMLEARQPQTKPGRDCIAALEATNATGAVKRCTTFAAQSPSDPLAPLSLGLAKLLANDPDEASRQFFRAAKIKPPFEPALFITLFGQPNSSRGITALDRITLSETDRATLDRALQDFKEGDFAAVEAGFQRLYDADASTGTVPLMLFIAQKRAGKTPTLDLASNPNGDAHYHMLAQALRGDKTPKDSFSEFSLKWGEDNSDYARNRFFLGEAALLQGDKAQAIRYFKKVLAAQQSDQIETDLAAAELKRLGAE
jgi:tetratricopeptide (TPR) repeat protein